MPVQIQCHLSSLVHVVITTCHLEFLQFSTSGFLQIQWLNYFLIMPLKLYSHIHSSSKKENLSHYAMIWLPTFFPPHWLGINFLFCNKIFLLKLKLLVTIVGIYFCLGDRCYNFFFSKHKKCLYWRILKLSIA